MDYHNQLFQTLYHFAETTRPIDHHDYCLQVIIEISKRLFDDSAKYKSYIDIQKEISDIDAIPEVLDLFPKFRKRLEVEVGIPKRLNYIFPIIRKNIGLIPISRLFANKDVFYFFYAMKTVNLHRIEKVKEHFRSSNLTEDQLTLLKDSIEVKSYEKPFLLPADIIFKFEQLSVGTEKNTLHTNKDKALLEVKSQVEILFKHKNLQEFFLFVGLKRAFSQHQKNYWITYESLLQVLYTSFPNFFSTQFNFQDLTTDDIRKRIGHYERVIKRYPVEIFNVWGIR